MLRAIYKKFTDYLPNPLNDKHHYVNAARVNDHYKMIVRGATQIDLVNDLKLDYIVTRSCGNKKFKLEAGEILNDININVEGAFNPRIMRLSIRLDQLIDINRLERMKESPKTIGRVKKMMQRISDAKDLNSIEIEVDSDVESTPTEPVESTPTEPVESTPTEPVESKPALKQEDEPKSDSLIDMPVIELEEHELFHDTNGDPVAIKVRGERSKNKILFKAKDVAKYFEMPLLIRTLMDDRACYRCGIEYVLLNKGLLYSKLYNRLVNNNSNDQSMLEEWRYYHHSSSTSTTNSNSKQTRINYNCVYLTLAGFIRVVCVSRSANANVGMVFDWIQTLIYVHQFGSAEERAELAHDLFKSVLNDKLSGLYCVDLGTIEEVAPRMGIDDAQLQSINDQYSLDKCGQFRLCKFGLSNDIATRIVQHQNKKDGYGRWSRNVSLKWMVLLSPSQLHEAEKLLSNLLAAKNYSFEYTDDRGKKHNELILYGPKDDLKVRSIYKQILGLFPSKENELCKLIEETQSKCEHAMLKMEYDYEMKLSQAKIDTMAAQSQMELSQAKMDTMLTQKDNQMLTLQLEIALMKLNSS